MPNSSSVNYQHNCTHGCLFDLIADPTEHVDLAFDPGHADVHARMLARAEYFDGTVFQSEGGAITKDDPAAKAKAEANGGFWGPWQPNKPLPPSPTPGPTPPPGPSFTLHWDAPADEHTANPTHECLVLSCVYKGCVAEMGECGNKTTQWVADGVGRLTPVGAKSPGKNYLRQKYEDGKPGCIVGNKVSLGTDKQVSQPD